MPTPPTGTVTILFTDIEGSTQLLQRLGDVRAAQVFAEHRRLLRAAFEAASGLQPRQVLLILDNCEHLVAACAHLAEALLRGCPRLQILATSREALGVAGEVPYRVPSLSLPDLQRLPSMEDLMKFEAVRLFIERAVSSRPGFAVTSGNAPAVVQTCQRLDGIPLAIELAAVRVKVLSVEQIARRLDDRFRLLTGGSRTAPPRHQTLQAVMDNWSYDLLSEAERTMLRRLSVFAGGFTLEAAEAVCRREGVREFEVLDLLSQLVDKSLVLAEPQGSEIRYRLLETVRQYGWDRLAESGEADKVRQRHREWFLGLAEQAEHQFQGREQGTWLDRLETEHDNLRAALEWCVEDENAEAGLRLAGALWRSWEIRSHPSEGRQWLEKILALPGASERTILRAKALNGAGILASHQGEYAAGRAFVEESLAIAREMGDRSGIALSLNLLGRMARDQGDYAAARALFEESLALRRALGDKPGVGALLNNLGLAASNHGDYAAARRLLEESLAIFRELGDEQGITTTLHNLGFTAWNQGDAAAARASFEESLAIARELGDRRQIAYVLSGLGLVAWDQGDHRAARAFFEESLAIRREVGDKRGIAYSLERFAGLAASQGQPERGGAPARGGGGPARSDQGSPFAFRSRSLRSPGVRGACRAG